jgi:hypothetical protein
MIKALSDMSLHLAEIVYRRAVREEAAAERVAALADDAVCEDVRPAPTTAASPAVASAEPEARAPSRAPASRRAPARPWALDAATLFHRLSATAAECLKMKAVSEETFKMMQARVPTIRACLLKKRKAHSPSRADAAGEVYDLTWAVIDEEQLSEEDGRNLRAAVVERVRKDPGYEDLALWPSTVAAALICEDIGLKPNRPDWLPEGAAPPGYIHLTRPLWSPFCRPSRKPYLKPPGHYLVDEPD